VAFNIQTFKTRSLTAIIFAVIMLLGLFLNAWSFLFLFCFILIGCLYEFARILKVIWGNRYYYYLPLSLIYLVMPVWMMIDLGIDIRFYTGDHKPAYELLHSPLFPCTIIFSIWINDTMAYIVGSAIGKTPFSKISAKKTWEGTIGGAVLCVIVISLFGSILYGDQIATRHWIFVSALAAVFGTLGDLFESKLKRMAGIKDSGTIMPGHGGFLDRFDSMLFAAPAVWFYVKAFL
jgi:phosphatidate cytidylyltransferase